MNTIRTNSVPLNRVRLNTIGEIRSSAGGGGGGGDVPDGYTEIVTADGMVFSAADGAFYVKL